MGGQNGIHLVVFQRLQDFMANVFGMKQAKEKSRKSVGNYKGLTTVSKISQTLAHK